MLSHLLQQFDERFSDFEVLQPHFQLFSTPFAEELQMELAELQPGAILKQKHAGVKISIFHLFLSREKFPKLLSTTAIIIAMFGSTNVCEQFFPSMKADKSVLKSRVTNEHQQATMRLIFIDEFKRNIEELADAKRSQLSIQKEN